MQIIVPMSGFGERFRSKGYRIPKPLIEIEGKPIIAHVMEMFPAETDFIFICNQEHLAEPTFQMRTTLNKLCPTAQIVEIAPHKYGPVYAVLQAAKHIKIDKPTIVNYCDFTCYWDWAHFKQWVSEIKCDGAIPAYKGFHPHSLGTVNYAYMREKNGWLLDIQEKKPFTDNRMNEYASSGTYYFANGQLMLKAFQQTIDKDMNIGGEYYVSLAYKNLLNDFKKIAVYDLQHFMQWGTPEDVAEYRQWSTIFHSLSNQKQNPLRIGGTIIMPMAGLGQRFTREGFSTPKPLIPVSGSPMVVQAATALPLADQYVFILRATMPGVDEISHVLKQHFPNIFISMVADVTEGQACTALLGLDTIIEQTGKEANGPITFAACDNGVLYDHDKLQALLLENETDVIVWVARGHTHAIRHPEMYGWVVTEDNEVKDVSVKIPLSSPETDPIIIGTFTFKRAEDFRRCVATMINRDGRVNGEYYIDTCIKDAISLGLKCKIFEVTSYISWGTPNDFRTFEYWQSCFHKWDSHPYRIQSDINIPVSQHETVDYRCRPTVPALLEPQI